MTVFEEFELEMEEMSMLAYSQLRAAALDAGLLTVRRSTLDDAAACLDAEDVCNDDSYQQMVFVPSTGELKVWRWIP